MRQNRLSFRFIAAFSLLLAVSQIVHAQAARTWVSKNGSDANNCSQATPCRTFAGALAKTNAGGEIDVMDASDFGPVTINKAVSIVSEGNIGGIQAATGNAITINAGANDNIHLRGLSLDGLGTGTTGISFLAGNALHVEGCTINNFAQYGIDFAPNTPSNINKLYIIDSIVRNNGVGSTGGGVHLIAFSFNILATIDNLHTENNVFGVKAENLATVTIRNSVAANNGFSGFSSTTCVCAGGSVRMVIENSVSTHNGTGGITSAVFSTVVLSNVTVTDNQTGLVNTSGSIISFGNNRIWGNVTDGTPTQTIAQQ